VTTAGAILLALDANSRGSLVGLLIVAPVWLVIAGVCLVRFVTAATSAGWRMPVAQWLRWLVIPWHLRRGAGVASAVERAKVGHFVVDTTGRAVAEVAAETLQIAGWTSSQ
jgi:hypothetical protein